MWSSSDEHRVNRDRARDELTRNVKAALEAQRMLSLFGVNLEEKRILGIKWLRDKLNLDLVDAKSAWEMAMELRSV